MRYSRCFLIALFVVFSLTLGAGTYLLFHATEKSHTEHPLVVEGKYEEGEVHIRLETTVPGGLLLVLGGAGLIVILIRVPVREIVSQPIVSSELSRMHDVSSHVSISELGPVVRVPILFWWFFYRAKNAVRAQEKLC